MTWKSSRNPSGISKIKDIHILSGDSNLEPMQLKFPVPMPYGSVWGLGALPLPAIRYLEPLHQCVRLIWVMILCRWQGPCELQLIPSLHSSQSAGRQCWILNACAFPVYYWISKERNPRKTDMLIALLHVTCIYLSLLGHYCLRISPKLSLSIRDN